ncbi:MAG: hypothetical protein LBU53_14055 [Zoogloeaceae bacterium]|jgi:hypothetical protein|nr:hypothetical protein [Zoogloeaceae bacterium]
MSRDTVKTRDGRVFELNTPEEEARIMAAALADPDAQPMTDEPLARMRPAREVLSPALYEALIVKRGDHHQFFKIRSIARPEIPYSRGRSFTFCPLNACRMAAGRVFAP